MKNEEEKYKRAPFYWPKNDILPFSGKFKVGDIVKRLDKGGKLGKVNFAIPAGVDVLNSEGDVCPYGDNFPGRPLSKLELTDAPWPEKKEPAESEMWHSIGSISSMTKFAPIESSIAAPPISEEQFKCLQALGVIGLIMKDKTLPPVLRFEKIANELEKVGML